MTVEEMKRWIDSASYESLLSKWRFSPPGNPFFAGELGDYYAEKMKEKRAADEGAAVRASKHIGW